MKIEIRNGSEIRVSGYVNAVERDSRVLPPEMAVGASSKFVEKVGAGAFRRAIERNPDVRLFYNHEREIGSVSGGQLKLAEDNIGLRAEAVITDPEVVEAAKHGELRGWSFGFSGAKSDWEDIGEGLKRRTLTDFDLSEVSILTKTPAYYGTSVEMRDADENFSVSEKRGIPDSPEIVRIPQNEQNTENTSCEGRFFYTKTQTELLKMKGEF